MKRAPGECTATPRAPLWPEGPWPPPGTPDSCHRRARPSTPSTRRVSAPRAARGRLPAGSSVSTQLLFPCPPWTSPRPHAEVRSWSPLSVSPLSKSFLSLTLSSCLGGRSFSALFPESSWWRMPKLFTPQLWWSPRSRVFRRLFPS